VSAAATVAGVELSGHSGSMLRDGNGFSGRRAGREPPRRPAEPCGCAWPGCVEAGLYPAPEARDRLRSFRWLCLEHVRAFNLGWDYFAGMSREEVEAHQRADMTWHRPTWRFGTRAGEPGGPRVDDPFGFFDDGTMSRPQRPASTAARMMAVLDLEVGFTLDELKRRYKTLAKQHHPDLCGGDRAAEERLKSIIEAYRYLLDHRAYA
jgi:hypothetical protein